MSGVCGGAEEVLVRVCRFDVKVSGDAVVVVERNSDIEEVNGCGGGFVGDFDGRMYVVKCGDEVCKFVLSMCPNQKNVVNKTPPYKGLIWCVF